MTVEAPPTAATNSRRRALIMLAALAGSLLIAVLFLTTGGDDDDGTTTPTTTPTSTVSATPSPDRTNEPPETDEAFEGRDPFEAFIVEPVAPPPVDGGPQPTSTPTDTGTVDDDDGGDTTVISLIDIFARDDERMATIEVDGEQFTVVEGETVNGNLKVLDIQRRCASFQFGDERFELCLGQEVRK